MSGKGHLLARLWRCLLDRAAEPPGVPEPAPAVAPRLSPAQLYVVGRKRVNWQTGWVKHLTPFHLKVSGDVPEDDPIVQGLRIQAVNLCILFTADWTKEAPSGTGRVATYAGAQREVRVALAEPGAGAPVVPRAAAEALVELVEWTYASEIHGDRLILVQNAVARSLQGNDDPAESYRSLLRRAPSIFDEVKTQWKVFVDGKVEEFLGQVQALEAEVAATVQAFSDRTSAMIKSLSDTVLAAVAVLIGSFIAALVKADTRLPVLWIGVGAYLAYLFVFPLGYNMAQQWQSFGALREQFEVRRRRFEERLYKEKVNSIVGDRVRRCETRFKWWFLATCGAYVLVAAAILIVVLVAQPLLPPPPPAT